MYDVHWCSMWTPNYGKRCESIGILNSALGLRTIQNIFISHHFPVACIKTEFSLVWNSIGPHTSNESHLHGFPSLPFLIVKVFSSHKTRVFAHISKYVMSLWTDERNNIETNTLATAVAAWAREKNNGTQIYNVKKKVFFLLQDKKESALNRFGKVLY